MSCFFIHSLRKTMFTMKNKIILFSAIFISSLFGFNFLKAQTVTGQPHLQLSEGGQPWSFKFNDTDSDILFENLPVVDNQAMIDADEALVSSGVKSLRFGFDHYVSLKLTNSGAWTSLANGDKVWRLGLSSPGAISMNISFKSMNLPEGCRLFVYKDDKTEFHGAFTQTHVTADDGMLGTELLFGEKVIVELYVPQSELSTVSLEIWRVTHGYRDLGPAIYRAFGASGACENNAKCPAYVAWDNQIRSGICLVNGGEFCSAALINNTCNDGVPYVLTANHCGSSGFGSWVFRFNWQAPTCTTPGSSPSSNSVSGAVQRAFFAGADMDLLQMNSTPPLSYNVYYAGWDRNNTAPVNPFGVHHPSGDIKKFSQSTGTGTTATYGAATCWQTPTWTDGVTEPGSSGSPLFNNAGLIVGQLYGGPSDCSCEGSASCGYDYYGKIFTSWTGGGTPGTRLSNWLDPCSTGATTLPGYDPNVPTIALDASINSITVPANGTTTCNNSFTPVVVLRNFGTTTLTSCTINYHLDAAAPSTFAWTGSLASGASVNITLPGFIATVAAHTYTAYTSSPNGGIDGNTANDSKTNNFTVLATPPGAALPFTEGFQPVTFPPTGWTLVNPDANGTWFRTTAAGGFGTSTASARFDNLTPATSIAGQSDYLVTPPLNLTGAGTLNLTFDVAHARYSATYIDTLNVWITTDCGGTWTRVYTKGGLTLATLVTDLTTNFVPTAAQWRTETINLSSYAGVSSAQIRFENKSGWGNDTYIDNVNLAFSTPPPVANFTGSPTTVCAGGSVSFTNTTTGGVTYAWTFPGGTPGTSTATNPTVTYSTPGTYNVTLVATGPGGTDTELKTGYIIVNGAPTTANAGTDKTACEGSTVSMTGNTATSGTGLWTKISGPAGGIITTPTSPTTTITTLAPGTYVFQWTISNAPCTASSDQVNIVVSGTPTIATAGPDQTICSTTTTVTMAGNTATVGSGIWTKISGPAGGTITTPSSPTTTITALVTGTYVYQWTITNAPCTSTSDQMSIIVNAPPTAANAGLDQTECSSAGTMTLAGNSATSGTGTWTQVSGPLSTITTPSSPTTTVTGLSTVGTYIYQWTISNNPCTASSDQMSIIITPGPTTALAGGDQNFCETTTSTTLAGNTVVSGTGLWTQISGPISTITTPSSPTSTITGMSGPGVYVYQWAISGAPCPTSTDLVTITVDAIPSVNAGTDITICAGDTATLNGTGSGTYSWAPPTDLSSTTIGNPFATPSGTATYTLTVTNGSCTNADNVTVNVNLLPSTPTISQVFDTLFASPATGFTYQWYLNGSPISGATNSTYIFTSNGNYTVEITDGVSCSSTSAITTVTNTGIGEIESEFISVFPNPNNGNFTVTINTLFGADCDVAIHNGVGQIIYSRPVTFNANTRSFELNLNGIAKGVYSLTVVDGNKRYNQKLVID